jgi:hypothetical protein
VHLRIGEAAVVVDADEDDLPAGSPASASAIPVDRMADPLDAAKAFGIDVEEAAGEGVLVALRRMRGSRSARGGRGLRP